MLKSFLFLSFWMCSWMCLAYPNPYYFEKAEQHFIARFIDFKKDKIKVQVLAYFPFKSEPIKVKTNVTFSCSIQHHTLKSLKKGYLLSIFTKSTPRLLTVTDIHFLGENTVFVYDRTANNGQGRSAYIDIQDYTKIWRQFYDDFRIMDDCFELKIPEVDLEANTQSNPFYEHWIYAMSKQNFICKPLSFGYWKELDEEIESIVANENSLGYNLYRKSKKGENSHFLHFIRQNDDLSILEDKIIIKQQLYDGFEWNSSFLFKYNSAQKTPIEWQINKKINHKTFFWGDDFLPEQNRINGIKLLLEDPSKSANGTFVSQQKNTIIHGKFANGKLNDSLSIIENNHPVLTAFFEFGKANGRWINHQSSIKDGLVYHYINDSLNGPIYFLKHDDTLATGYFKRHLPVGQFKIWSQDNHRLIRTYEFTQTTKEYPKQTNQYYNWKEAAPMLKTTFYKNGKKHSESLIDDGYETQRKMWYYRNDTIWTAECYFKYGRIDHGQIITGHAQPQPNELRILGSASGKRPSINVERLTYKEGNIVAREQLYFLQGDYYFIDGIKVKKSTKKFKSK